MQRSDPICKKIQTIINYFAFSLAILFFLTGLISVLLQITGRVTQMFMISWTEELARFCFVGVALFGSVLLVSENAHLKVEILQEIFPERINYYLGIAINVISIIFLVILSYLSWGTAVFNIRRLSSALRISASVLYFALFVSCLLMLAQAIINIILLVHNKHQHVVLTRGGK